MRRGHAIIAIGLLGLPAGAQQQRIVLFGPPGVGKGTQAKRIIQKHGLCHVSTGDLLRAEVKKASKIGQKVKSLMARGHLVPDKVVVRLVIRMIAGTRTCERRGWLLDGFPRTATQVHALMDAGLVPHQIIVLNATNATIIARALSRAREATAAGQTPRKDDNEPTMRRRIAEYERNRDATLVALRQYIRITEVDGEDERGRVEGVINQLIPRMHSKPNDAEDTGHVGEDVVEDS